MKHKDHFISALKIMKQVGSDGGWYTALDRMVRENLSVEMNWSQGTERKRRLNHVKTCISGEGN